MLLLSQTSASYTHRHTSSLSLWTFVSSCTIFLLIYLFISSRTFSYLTLLLHSLPLSPFLFLFPSLPLLLHSLTLSLLPPYTLPLSFLSSASPLLSHILSFSTSLIYYSSLHLLPVFFLLAFANFFPLLFIPCTSPTYIPTFITSLHMTYTLFYLPSPNISLPSFCILV